MMMMEHLKNGIEARSYVIKLVVTRVTKRKITCMRSYKWKRIALLNQRHTITGCELHTFILRLLADYWSRYERSYAKIWFQIFLSLSMIWITGQNLYLYPNIVVKRKILKCRQCSKFKRKKTSMRCKGWFLRTPFCPFCFEAWHR